MLAFVAAARLLLLSKVVELSGDGFGSQPQIWLVFILNALFGILFAASAYGLWGRYTWGRILFLWGILFWSAFELFSLFIGNDATVPAIIAGVFRVAIGLLISLWYFNLPRIKMLFHGQT